MGGTKNHINIKYILNSIHKYNKLLKITVLIVNKEDFIFLRNNFKNNKNIKLIFRIKNVHKILSVIPFTTHMHNLGFCRVDVFL